LTFIINLSFSTGIFPSSLKEAKITAIWKKKGKKSDATNYYRPINILPAISKIFEGAILERLVEYLEIFNCLDFDQYGLRQGKSCEQAITAMVNLIILCLDQDKKVVSLKI